METKIVITNNIKPVWCLQTRTEYPQEPRHRVGDVRETQESPCSWAFPRMLLEYKFSPGVIVTVSHGNPKAVDRNLSICWVVLWALYSSLPV